jgi:prepilin-type N-terminal cleavage/methylation domain-containing protein
MKARFSPRPAFTLVELLVVIAIIGILVALLLPAIQAAREASRRTQCANHLKQLGLGCQNHHSAIRIFPDGGEAYNVGRTLDPPSPATNGVPVLAPKQSWGWLYQILPYIEQEPLYNNPSDSYIQGIAVKTFFCPTRRQPMVIGGRGVNDYAGNGGLYTSSGWDWGNGQNGGVIVRQKCGGPCNTVVSTALVTDGTANTIILGEKRLDSRAIGTAQCDDNEGHTSGWDWDIIRWGNDPPLPDRDATDQCEVLFGSAHPAGLHFAFCDGKVRFIGFDIDRLVFQRLCRRDDREPVTVPN